jgi:chromosome partitioning protein
MKTIAFFNNKGGVGKTTLAYHLAWMFSKLGERVIIADLDPQANLSSMFVPDERMFEIMDKIDGARTIYETISPIINRKPFVEKPYIENINDSLGLLIGDLRLAGFEDTFSHEWSDSIKGQEGSLRVTTAFNNLICEAGKNFEATFALIDVGPNLGALNRNALICADYVIIPMGADLYSLQGLENLGKTLKKWREAWSKIVIEAPDDLDFKLPKAEMKEVGYILMQPRLRNNTPVNVYLKWANQIPERYRIEIFNDQLDSIPDLETDPYCLAIVKNYASLMPLAITARKPMFSLTAADGALGGHIYAVRDCFEDFKKLAKNILHKIN